MNLDLRELEVFPADVAVDVEADSTEYGIENISFRDLMNVKLNVQKVKDEYYCHGYVTVPVEVECSRCLAMFNSNLAGELTFIVRAETATEVLGADDEADVILIKPGEPVVEMDDLIRQALLLSLPLKPLCSTECKGLCPNCGVNLNEETCGCKGEEVDERWEGLRDLLE
jgi:uncharacterized protein